MTGENKTNILPIPENKNEKIFYYLYDNGEQPTDILMKIVEIENSNAFYQLRNRNKDDLIISRKEGLTSYYDISLERREKIKLLIEQKARQLEEEKRENLKKQLEEEKKEERILELKGLIQENKRLIERKENNIFLNCSELMESNHKLYDYLLTEPDSFISDFKIATRDFGFEKYNLRFKEFETIKAKAIESLRHTDINQLVLIKSQVGILSDVRPQIIKIKYECPSCGTIISIEQIESKIREPSRCSCGRKGGFKPVEKVLIDRAKAQLQDLIDLTESPQTREISSFVYDYMTESKELSKLNPGSSVKILGILKAVEMNKAGYKTTSLDLYLNILEIEPFEEVIDLNSFEDEEIKQFEEISAIISNENNLNKVKNSFSPDIIGVDSVKNALILKLAQKDKGNIGIISDPGKGKSRLMKKYHALMPGSNYSSATGSSMIGLTATVEKTDDGWVCKPGLMPKTKEDLIIEEFNLLPEEDRGRLQEGMSEKEISVNKASIQTRLKIRCGVILTANPDKGVFDSNENLLRQINIPPQILNRLDALFIIKDSNSEEEDKQISRSMLLRDGNKISQELSDEFLKRYFLYIRNQPEPSFDKELYDYIPQKYSEIRKLRRFTNEGQIINARFIESVIRFSKSMAKIKLSEKITKRDVDFVLELLKETYLNLDFSGGLLK